VSLESDFFKESNTKLLLLTGAGASKPLGMPLMREFYDLISNNLDRDQRQLLSKILQMHMKEIGEDTAEVTPDLEILLALIERYINFYHILFEDAEFGFIRNDEWKRWAEMEVKGLLDTYAISSSPSNRGPDYLAASFSQKQQLERLRNSLLDLIFEAYSNELDDHKLDNLYSPLLERIGKRISQGCIPIFTTNYDSVFETYAENAGVRLETGFATTYSGAVWKPSRFYQF
jgi:hypothetical protein